MLDEQKKNLTLDISKSSLIFCSGHTFGLFGVSDEEPGFFGTGPPCPPVVKVSVNITNKIIVLYKGCKTLFIRCIDI